jgi:hypothetical protein
MMVLRGVMGPVAAAVAVGLVQLILLRAVTVLLVLALAAGRLVAVQCRTLLVVRLLAMVGLVARLHSLVGGRMLIRAAVLVTLAA